MADSLVVDYNASGHQHSHEVVVIPGQLLAESSSSSSSSSGEDSFISGHGTYIVEHHQSQPGVGSSSSSSSGDPAATTTLQLRASICGTIRRINKLICVDSIALYHYIPQVGDLMIGRVKSIQNDKWILDLSTATSTGNGSGHLMGILPLSSVHLPGKSSVQQKRTATDVLEMRHFIKENDLVSCEVHKVQHSSSSSSNSSSANNNIILHTRSIKYGKLENGCCIRVPPKLILRRKTHYTTIINHQFQILIGCNGIIWIQRNNNCSNFLPSTTGTTTTTTNQITTPTTRIAGQQELSEAEEMRRIVHAETSTTINDRQKIARIYNSIVILRMTGSYITPEIIETIYHRSFIHPGTIQNIANMVLPEHVELLMR